MADVADNIDDINDTIIDINKDIKSMIEKLEYIAYTLNTLIAITAFGLGYLIARNTIRC